MAFRPLVSSTIYGAFISLPGEPGRQPCAASLITGPVASFAGTAPIRTRSQGAVGLGDDGFEDREINFSLDP
jgi:hypothetical protein